MFKCRSLIIPILAGLFTTSLFSMEHNKPHIPKERGEKQVITKSNMPTRILRCVTHYKYPILAGCTVLGAGVVYSYCKQTILENFGNVAKAALSTTAAAIGLQIFKEALFSSKKTIAATENVTLITGQNTQQTIPKAQSKNADIYRSDNVKTKLIDPETFKALSNDEKQSEQTVSTAHPFLKPSQPEIISTETQKINAQLIKLIQFDLSAKSTVSRGVLFPLVIKHPKMAQLFPLMERFYGAMMNVSKKGNASAVKDIDAILAEINAIISPEKIILWTDKYTKMNKKLEEALTKDVAAISQGMPRVYTQDVDIRKNMIFKVNKKASELVIQFYSALMDKPHHSSETIQKYLDKITDYLGFEKIVFQWAQQKVVDEQKKEDAFKKLAKDI